MPLKKPSVFFVSILCIGLAVRLWYITQIPAGFFADEASIGYNAYTILNTGRDQYGARLPIFFKAFGEYKSPIQLYSTVPFVLVFGLNELATRLPSVVYGLLSLAALYLLVKELFPQDNENLSLALLSLVFLTISPWAIHMSRVALEGLMAFVFFTTLGLYLFLKAQHWPAFLPFSIIVFVLALYSYFPARIFIPLFGIGLLVLYHQFFFSHKRETGISLFVLILILFPVVRSAFSPTGLSRWQQINIFSHPPRRETIVYHIAHNYLLHFSADFLFLKGDIDMPGQFITRHSVRGLGELYVFQLPLVVVGLYVLAKRKNKISLVLLWWLLLYPVGSMFTIDTSPQATRSIIGVIPFQILSALGAGFFLRLISPLKRWLYLVCIGLGSAIILFSFAQYLSLYFVSYVNYASDYWGWQYGARSIMEYFLAHKSRYDEMYMSPNGFNSPEIFITFYDPANNCKGKCRVGNLDNYHSEKKQLFVIDANHLNFRKLRIHIVQIIYYPNNQPAYFIAETQY